MPKDELKLYRGEDYMISDHIHIHQPTLNEICDYGEAGYYTMIYQLTATPQSMKAQLWDAGVDYTKITPFELFYSILYKLFSVERTSILFGGLDFSKFQLMQKKEDGAFLLFQVIDGHPVIIDEFTYHLITDYLREVHMIQKDEKLPANDRTKMILIEDAKEELLQNTGKEYHSRLKNLISSMINREGFKYNHSQVWDMKINAFLDAVRRISKIKNADLLLQSGYSGFGVNLKEVPSKQLDWFGELD